MVKVLQLFVALSLLIVLHEGGHFFFARLFKTRVEKFYLFFDFLFPFSGVLNFPLFKKKVGDTEYGIGWFPLGGYVKIAGMVDESMDKEQMALPPQPWEYRSKKAYQRLFIMLGGIIVNTLLAIVLYIIVFGVYGEEYLPVQNAKFGIMVDSTAKAIGLHNGDKVVSINHEPVERFERILPLLGLGKGQTIQVERDGQMVDLKVTPEFVGALNTRKKGGYILPRMPVFVEDISKGSTADKMGLAPGDSIIGVNGVPIHFYDEFDSFKTALVGKQITLTVARKGTVLDKTTIMPKDTKLGFHANLDVSKYFKLMPIKYNPIEAVSRGFVYTFEKFSDYVSSFKLLFSKEVKLNESMGGIISFGKIFPGEFDMQKFLMLTAFVSIILAFMNLLPIPGLDGGYVIFLLYEMITGKQVSEKVMERATSVGLVLLLTLMVYANGLDIFRLFKH